MNKVITGVLVIAVLVGAVFLYNKYRVAPEIDFNSLQLTDLNDRTMSLLDFKGKKVFVNFWGTWCGPCIKEMPELEKLQSILAGEGFVFVCISDEPLSRLKSFKERTGNNLAILHSVTSFQKLKVFTIPASYLLNMEGKVVFKKTGKLDLDENTGAEKLRNALR